MKKREFIRVASVMMTVSVLAASVTGCGASSASAPCEESVAETAVAADVCEEASDYDGNYDDSIYAQAPMEAASDQMSGADKGDAYETPAYEESAETESAVADYSSNTREETNRRTNGAMKQADKAVPSTERYEAYQESGFSMVEENPLSTFSADVDTASYANVRRMIQDGYGLYDIDPDAVRVEEFLNYFSYDLNKPGLTEKFGVTTQLAQCPWNTDHELMLVGMSTKDLDLSRRPSSNLVFLLDVSGSMGSEDKLPLLQKSFIELTDSLTEKDHVSIVTYASGVKVVLENASGDQKEYIKEAISSLTAGGGTNGEGGIQTAYALAEETFIKNGNNRIILATDGDLNIGVSDPDELEKLISQKKESGVFLSVLGFGTGNIKDDNMERLADKGNGNYAYIDSLFEAKKVLVEEMGANLNTVAKDVKLQVEFNPENVKGYRLLGYENRRMADRDFYDDTKDAGEIGAGHQVVALYELIPATVAGDIPLKYGKTDAKVETCKVEKANGRYSDEYATVKIAYKEPNKEESKMFSRVVNTKDFVMDDEKNIHFAAMVAEFAMLLSDSAYVGDVTMEDIAEQYQALRDKSDFWDEYKEEFFYLVKTMCRR